MSEDIELKDLQEDIELLYREAVLQWGEDAQVIQTLEELAELSKALCKQFRRDNTDEILEEMADVLICIGQLKVIFDRNFSFESLKLKKLARLSYKLETNEWIDWKSIQSDEKAKEMIRGE